MEDVYDFKSDIFVGHSVGKSYFLHSFAANHFVILTPVS